VCHDSGSFVAVDEEHAIALPTVSNVVFTVDAPVAGDLQVTYNLKLDGVDTTDFTAVQRDYRTEADGTRFDLGAITAATSTGNGNYSITIPGGAAAAGTASRYMFRIANPAGARAVVVEDFPAAPWTDAVSNQGCINCHGETGIFQIHGGGYSKPAGMEVCTVCHKSTAYDFEDAWFGIIHGVHNSHNMPSGHYEYDATHIFSVTYPTYMNNCSVCHTETDMLAAANGMTVTKDSCFSCHESTEGFGEALDGLEFHSAYDDVAYPSEICLDCHVVGGAAREYVAVTDFHNGLQTERAGIIWDGVDTSVIEGAKFNWQITGVVDNGTTLAISWTASYDGLAVDPCNATVAANAPAFHAIPALPPVPPATSPTNRNNLSVLYTYAQGEDPIRGTASDPGQAANVGVSTTNTVCAANVATTTITPARVAGATRARIALQGKPWVLNADPSALPMQVRAKTPVYDFVVGTGAKASDRRVIVDTTDKCLKCHVGSLYQHGGNRVDNVEMCILCHNSASNEQSVRVGMGVTASEAYDGKVGQTFEMKTMLHAIHSAGEAGSPPIVIYRNRGIYAWAPEGTVIPNWPGTGSQPVFGSDDGTGAPVMQTHNYHNPTYPRLLNDCAACHAEDWESLVPDQAIAMATTLDAGDEPWTNQVDDVLQGAGAAACTSCHKSGAALGHAYQNGWEPSTFEDGRQTIIDAAP
jgi:OmcA/MtrC family decaheme c-type cytochrome